MSVPDSIVNLVGSWSGANKLWMMPGEPVHESGTTMTITAGERRGFATLKYTWAEGGEPQEGLLALGLISDPPGLQASWIDTFHTAGGFMAFQGTVGADGGIALQGSYPAPEGPDWGWEIRITPKSRSEFLFAMFNITPDGEVYPAVEAMYTRS